MKSVAFYIGDFTRSGGTERSCISVVNGLSRYKNFKVYLITTNSKEQASFFSISPNVQVIYLNISSHKIGYISLVFKLINAIIKNHISVLVAVEVMSMLFVFPAFLCSRFVVGVHLIVWEHFNFSVSLGRKMRFWCRKLSAKFACRIVVLTKRDCKLWQDHVKIKAKILVIGNTSPYEVSNIVYNSKSHHIVAIGRLTYQKGFDRLVSIWHKFILRYPEFSDWKLYIVGSGVDEPLLKIKIKEYQLVDQIVMVPNTSNIQKYYEDASFLVMTSRFEGLPMTLIEAQSFGLPIIAYDCMTGPSEVLSENSGLLIPDGDEAQFIEGLKQLMSDEILRGKMSENALVEVMKFSENCIIEKWVNLINGI